MPVTRYDPKTTIRTTFECDRCHRVEAVETAVDEKDEDVSDAQPPVGWKVLTFMPGGWVGHDALDVVFCQRACMSTWLGNQVRAIYGEELIEQPKLRGKTSRKKAAPATAIWADSDAPTVTADEAS